MVRRTTSLVTTLLLVACGGGEGRVREAHPEKPRSDVTPGEPPIELPSERLRREEALRVASSVHALLGVPIDADPSDDYLADRQAYVLSYNPRRNVANWVSWRLTKDDIGAVDRANDFRADDALPSGFYHVSPKDYVRSGFDRGHLCPSADRTSTKEQNSLTFLMSNMHPQRPEMNQVTWKKLEEYERRRAMAGDVDLYITVGGIFDPTPETIGNGVAVPKYAYKIIVVAPRGARVSDLGASTEVIAVSMPNTKEVKEHPFADYATSVDAIEAASGYDFLGRLAPELQAVLEAKRATL